MGRSGITAILPAAGALAVISAAFLVQPGCAPRTSSSRSSSPTRTPTPWMSPILLQATISYSGSVIGSHPLVLEFRKASGGSVERIWRTVATVGAFPATIAIDQTSLPVYTTVRAWWAVSGSPTLPLAGDPVSATASLSSSGTFALVLQ